MEKKLSAEQLLFYNYIKYDKMVSLVAENFKGSNSTSINLYIDLYSIFKQLYSNNIYVIEDKLSISSSIINLCVHMRHFFRNRYKVETKIFLVYSSNTCEYNKQIWLGYNKSFEQHLLKQDIYSTHNMIENNIKLLELLVPYLSDIHLIKSKFEVGVAMYDIMCYTEANGNKDPNIVLSTDNYLFQLVYMVDNTIIFRPKKYKSEDLSYSINKNNLLSILFDNRKVQIPTYINELDSGLYSLLLTLSRVPERSLESLFNLPKASIYIKKAVSENKILNGYNSNLSNIWYSMYDKSFERITFDLFSRRFKVIDLFSQYLVYINSNHEDIKLINLYDANAVRAINNEYFKNSPIDLNRL